MRILQLTPGAGGMYCGACMRDNALAATFRRMGHDVLFVPLYTPFTVDEKDQSSTKIFFGGINVFLQQKSALFAKLPAWIAKKLDDAALIRYALNFSVKTDGRELGELTVSMLKGEDGNQARELDKLLEFLKDQPRFDVIVLSNVLLAGLIRRLRRDLGAPVFCTLQGEDTFLDSFPEPQREQAWKIMSERAAEADGFIAVSRYYGDLMQARMNLPRPKIHVVHNGIELDGYAPAPQPPSVPTVGYLARMCEGKGVKRIVDAFAHLRSKHGFEHARLRIAGSVTPSDKTVVEELKARTAREGFAHAVEFLPNVSREEKIRFLQSLSVFSVPAEYGEAFGLYVLEAMACGIPVVQPGQAAFPELIEATGGGILYNSGDSEHLAAQLAGLLKDEPRRQALGQAAHAAVHSRYGIQHLAENLLQVYAGVAAPAQNVAGTAESIGVEKAAHGQ